MSEIENNIIEMIKENLMIKTNRIKEVETGIELKREDLRGIEEILDLRVQIDTTLGMKMKRESVITVESQGIL